MPKQFLDEAGLAVVATYVNEKLKVVSTMPATPTNGQVVLYVGATTSTYTQGGIYLYNGTAWVLISTADVDLTPYKKIFTGTREEWGLLSTAEKKEYDEADLSDDLAGGELIVSDAVTAGDLNPVTSNAVANKISTLIKRLRVSDITTDAAGNASLGVSYMHVIPITYIDDNPGASLCSWAFGRYGDIVYIVSSKKNSSISGYLYYINRSDLTF